MSNQHTAALTFRSLHHGPAAPLALANVWDAAGARLVEEAGATALAITSAGAAWSLGVAEFGRLGAARVSLGSALAEAAYGTARRAAREFLTTGTCPVPEEPVGHQELNLLLSASG
ncbi:isocitrate lyase/phosphoenolpyruvate mutase family protein [Streptomyces sp. NBC_01433]|uniref:isocitrate lyase/phosphoenolpyruvate mutase family protein n=1 Tax=Streptomyces sp. NBC_01433 TaxID=2903864 RepID=UPI002B1CBB22|nr:isocitrate lyase/phosphoenolpyruvate mutase family protein [Streptomyces sp. NBC_01433]